MDLRAGLIATALLLAACGAATGPADHHQMNDDRITAGTVLSTYPRPDDWHRLALYGNWDFIDVEAWREIAMQPDCDRATALAIFWKASPEYYAQFANRAEVPAANLAGYDLITLVRVRWQAEAYRREQIAFDPESDAWPVDFQGLRQQYGERVDQLVPAEMRVRLTGRRLSRTGFQAPGLLGTK